MNHRTRWIGSAAFALALGSAFLTWQISLAAVASARQQAATTTPTVAAGTARATPEATRAASATAEATRSASATAVATAATAAATVSVAATPAASATVTETETTQLSLADLADYKGIPVGFTADGHPFMGDPNAPVRMDEFSDYLCPYCGRHFDETTPQLIDEYVLTGKLMYVFRDFPIAQLHPNAPEGHRAAWCVGQDDAVKYWTMHDALFGRQQEWNRLPDVSEFLAGVAEEAGADPAAYKACMDAGETTARVDAGIAAGQSLGFNGTPTFVFSGPAFTDTYTLVGAYPVDNFRQWIDAMAEGNPPPQEPQAPEAPQAELPLWANEKGLALDPDRPGYDMAGDQVRGAEDAPLTIVEFSDYQCPACAKHANEVQPALDKAFVDTGKVRWVFKNRPLSIHPLAPVAAAAAECAADQGKFWEMHELLYQTVGKWAPEQESWTEKDAEAALIGLAKEIGLDADTFDACITSREVMERVLYDVYDAEGVVNVTPSFIAIYGGQGKILSGSQPVSSFSDILTNLVQQAEQAAGPNESTDQSANP